MASKERDVTLLIVLRTGATNIVLVERFFEVTQYIAGTIEQDQVWCSLKSCWSHQSSNKQPHKPRSSEFCVTSMVMTAISDSTGHY